MHLSASQCSVMTTLAPRHYGCRSNFNTALGTVFKLEDFQNFQYFCSRSSFHSCLSGGSGRTSSLCLCPQHRTPCPWSKSGPNIVFSVLKKSLIPLQPLTTSCEPFSLSMFVFHADAYRKIQFYLPDICDRRRPQSPSAEVV